MLYLTQRSIEEVDFTYLFWAIAVLLAWAHGSIMYSITLQVYIIIFYCTTLMLSLQEAQQLPAPAKPQRRRPHRGTDLATAMPHRWPAIQRG